MTDPEQTGPDERTPRRFSPQRKLAAAGLAAGLIGGGAAGMLLGNSPSSGAATVAAIQAEPPADDDDGPGDRRGEHLAEVLAPLVDNGTINQEQADAVITALGDAAEEHREARGGHRGPPRRQGLVAAADALGMEASELGEALRDGSSIAEVAGDRGVDVQTVIDAMVAEASERLDEQVAAGNISEEEAAERLAEVTERVTEHVSNGPPERGPRNHPGGSSGS